MRLYEIGMQKRDYVRCPDGTRHDYTFAGGTSREGKTNRTINNMRCLKCDRHKTVFTDSGKRVNR